VSATGRLDSASGLKPTTAFVLVAGVLGLIGLKAGKIALWDEGEQPRNLMHQHVPDVTFDILDSNGTPIALSVERLELVMSPNAAWQAHTPDHMAALLSRALGPQYPPDRLLEVMLPDARGGAIRVQSEPLLLDAQQARAVQRWILTGSTGGGGDPEPVRGIRIEADDRPGRYAIVWQPVVVLSEASREEHNLSRPLDWSRRIADDLYACVQGRPIREALSSDEEISAARREIWEALMPCQFKCVVKEVAPETAMAVWSLLKEERVRGHQMDLLRVGRRVYPARAGLREDPPLAVLGRWGTLEPEQAKDRARKSLGLPEDRLCSETELDRLRTETELRVYQPSPMSGIELLGKRLLEREQGNELEKRSEQYTYLANQAPRQPLQRYFQELIPASETPHLVTTIDLPLQRQVRLELERLMELHRPAAAMAVALDVPTGKVLAADAIDPYGMGGFLPTLHTFTPGSTMKVVVMATALDAGVVTPEDRFNTFNGHLRLGSREIGEAEGAQTGIISAARGLAYSCNAVLVQIGLRIPAEVLHSRFLELGYSRYPDTGLGGERCGTVPKLPWARNYAHASVSFGHEMLVTLWQHAAALATVVRGGEYRPLTLIEAVEQGGVRHPVPLAEPKRVFSQRTCQAVRDMMEMGAREGTGKRVYCPYLEMGTKTGTAEKVPDEVCLHVELEHNRVHGCRGAIACRRSLVGVHTAHKGPCYTSSMCAYGRLPGTAREVMVLVVVDEPRGGKKFGADVAGPAAVAILEEALGSRRGGVRPPPLTPEGFANLDPPHGTARASSAAAASPPLPWEEVRLAAR
jgi:cell division protein FtsI/penicillin-binding protein 2